MKRLPHDDCTDTRAHGSSSDMDRRSALKLFSAGLALSLAGCGRPAEEIVPYVNMPEGLVPGVPRQYATTLALNGYGRGVLAISVDGRPIKIEGNPRHPASLGATDVFAEAAIMSLYDPNRLQAPRHGDDIATWDAFTSALYPHLKREKKRGGAALRFVSGRVTSPTLQRQMADIKKQFPQARWYQYQPVSDDNILAGTRLAYGQPLIPRLRLQDAAVVLALDADPLGAGPEQIANASNFSHRRRRQSKPFMRLYAVEGEWTLTGASADNRLALHPALIRNFALAVAAAMTGGNARPHLPDDAAHLAKVCAADLKAHKGKALVTVGRRQPAEVHALCHWINGQLDAPIEFVAPLDDQPQSDADTLQALAQDLDDGNVGTLIVIGANPAYDTPGHLGIAHKIAKVPFSACLSLHDDETAARCHWRLPMSHPLESWSDLRAPDGTASIVQPLIHPLYDSRSSHEVLGTIVGETWPSSYKIVRETWKSRVPSGQFEELVAPDAARRRHRRYRQQVRVSRRA